MSNYRKRNKKRKLNIIGKLLVVLGFILIAAAIAAVLCCTVFFKVKTVNVSSDIKIPYATKTVIQASDLIDKANYFTLDKEKTAKNLCSKLSYINKVEIEKVFPDTVNLKLTVCVPFGQFEIKSKYILVDSNGKVLEISDKTFGKRKLICPKISETKVCEKVLCEQKAYENETLADAIENMASVMNGTVLEGVTSIDFSDGNNITMSYQDRIKLIVGKNEFIKDKMKLAAASIEKLDSESTSYTGTLDLSVHRDARFIEKH